MIIKLLYAALVICVLSLVAVAGAAYMRVRRHLQQPHPPEPPGTDPLHTE